MGKVVEKTKKKKGRPSLLDLQKRHLKQQKEEELRRKQLEQQQQLRRSHKIQNPNPNNTRTPVRRSTRRNLNPDSGDDEAASDAEQSIGKCRKKKKIKLVSKLPDSSVNSDSLNSGSNSNLEEEDDASASLKKRRIEPIMDRSGQRKDDRVGDKQAGGGSINPTNIKLDENGPSTPLPDKTLLLFIVDRLQKKDTYGVFSEPVDPEELPDYHEVIKHPMDFTTLRKKLTSGAYANLEQFEKDVFLLCSNAMQYNSPDTIYFRQACSIQELAKKSFENLRQESDDNEAEKEIVRRGRPPSKHLKRPFGRPPLECSVDKYASPDPFGRGSRQVEVYISWSADKYDQGDEIIAKGISMKHLKKTIIVDENRHNTYNFTSSGEQDLSSTFAIFQGHHKHLIPVGLQTEYGFARSLARFACKLGPVAWKVASKKIERCLAPGVKFGPGWVAENDLCSLESVLPNSCSATPPENQQGTDSLESAEQPSLRPGPSFQVHQQHQSMLHPCVNGTVAAETNPEKLVGCLSDHKAPDLNVLGFQSPSGRPEAMQPELTLQL